MGVMISPKSLCILSSIVPHKTSSGVCPALPMGVAPEAIVEKLIFEYRLKDNVPSFMSWDYNITQ
jgi:hypothetical protein